MELNMGKLGVVAPFKVKEGTISIKKTAGVGGSKLEPVLSAQVEKGTPVTLTGEMQVAEAAADDVIIGVCYNEPKWVNGVEPRTDYTQAQAISADMLREAGIETVFKKILTVPAKTGEDIAAGDNITWNPSVEKADSATGIIALTNQTSDDFVTVGFI